MRANEVVGTTHEHDFRYHGHSDPQRIGQAFYWTLASWPCKACGARAVGLITSTEQDEYGDWAGDYVMHGWTEVPGA